MEKRNYGKLITTLNNHRNDLPPNFVEEVSKILHTLEMKQWKQEHEGMPMRPLSDSEEAVTPWSGGADYPAMTPTFPVEEPYDFDGEGDDANDEEPEEDAYEDWIFGWLDKIPVGTKYIFYRNAPARRTKIEDDKSSNAVFHEPLPVEPLYERVAWYDAIGRTLKGHSVTVHGVRDAKGGHEYVDANLRTIAKVHECWDESHDVEVRPLREKPQYFMSIS
jgi:hypothetical protein